MIKVWNGIWDWTCGNWNCISFYKVSPGAISRDDLKRDAPRHLVAKSTWPLCSAGGWGGRDCIGVGDQPQPGSLNSLSPIREQLIAHFFACSFIVCGGRLLQKIIMHLISYYNIAHKIAIAVEKCILKCMYVCTRQTVKSTMAVWPIYT